MKWKQALRVIKKNEIETYFVDDKKKAQLIVTTPLDENGHMIKEEARKEYHIPKTNKWFKNEDRFFMAYERILFENV